MDSTFSSTRPDHALISTLTDLSKTCTTTTDQWGNIFVWATLHAPVDLLEVARTLHEHNARLCTVTALTHALYTDPVVFLDYHFDICGAIYSVIVPLDPLENSVPTITHWFRNADWNERECAELYDIHVEGNTNPQRLFLDESIDQGILNEVIPLSIMMNGACTTDMWEHITAMNLSTAPHSVFPAPDGPAEAWPPLVDPTTPAVTPHPLPMEDATPPRQDRASSGEALKTPQNTPAGSAQKAKSEVANTAEAKENQA